MEAFKRPSKLRLPEIMPTATRSRAAIAAARASASAPEPLPQVMQPNPTRWKPRPSNASASPAFASIAGTTREPGENEVLTQGLVRNPLATALRASRPAAIIWYGLAVFVQEVIDAMAMSPCCRGRDIDVTGGAGASAAPCAANALRNLCGASASGTRLSGRDGPANDGSTPPRSNSSRVWNPASSAGH